MDHMLHTNKSEDKTKSRNERPTTSEYTVSFMVVLTSLTSPFTIELANGFITGESVYETAVIGARWTLNSGTLPPELSGARGHMVT